MMFHCGKERAGKFCDECGEALIDVAATELRSHIASRVKVWELKMDRYSRGNAPSRQCF